MSLCSNHASELFLDTWNDGMLADHIASKLTCVEVETLCGLMEAFGHSEVAQMWRESHAEGDDDTDDTHHDLYLQKHRA